ncbi:MAG: TraB family-domain-containing protein [Monoraphidium minutum]|nr:MAG: TraB family-domain-containing protein [Monoraphidium minutum]
MPVFSSGAPGQQQGAANGSSGGGATRGPQRSRRVRARTAAHAAAAPAPLLLSGPPAGYDFRADIMPDTRDIIGRSHPELQDLVDEGVLVAHRRPAAYAERRTDGYREPEVVYLVGTAHVSAKSADDVRRVVQAVQPEAVVVELCRSRTALLHAGAAEGAARQEGQQQAGRDTAADGSFEEQQQAEQRRLGGAAASTSSGAPPGPSSSSGGGGGGGGKASNPLGLSGASFAEAMQRALSQGGQSGLVLRLLLASQARRAAGRLGVRPGAEFAAAAAAADAAGAQLVLGDRPVEITLQRAWGALGWRRRAALLADLGRAALAPLPPELSAELVEALKSDGAVSAMFAQWSTRYPELISPLVAERDLYLAWSLKRSKAVNGSRCVVGVVGKGHMQGIVYALRHDSGELRFADLVGGKNRRSVRRREAAVRLATELALGAGAYALWLWFTGEL